MKLGETRILDVIQGSDEWLAARSAHDCTSSEAPAMMGAHKHTKRGELLKMRALGMQAEFSAWAQEHLLDAGHDAEDLARPIVEAMLVDELYPLTLSREVDGMRFLASLDGRTIDGRVIWEHKTWNQDLVKQVLAADLDPHYWWQLEEALLVSDAEYAVFTCSDGTAENCVSLDYRSWPERREMLVAGVKQFMADLAAYQHVEVLPPPEPEPVGSIPALFVQVEGRVLASNIDAFKDQATAFVAAINTDLSSDQDFATADKATKALKEAEERIDLIKAQTVAQTASIDELFRVMDDIREQMRSKRLTLEKLVKTRKETIRAEMIRAGQQRLAEHIDALNAAIGGKWMPVVEPGFQEAIKGLKTMATLHDAVETALANAKTQASLIAARIDANRKALVVQDGDTITDWFKLFPDFKAVCVKEPDDFALLLQVRIGQHKADQERAIEANRQADAAKAAAAQAIEAARQPDATPIASPAIEAAKQAAVLDHQDDVRTFIASREWRSVRAADMPDFLHGVLVEYNKFVAARAAPQKKAA